MRRCLAFVDGVSTVTAWIARGVLVALVVAMLYEVFARYLFNAPTRWAFDMSYMLNGSIFLLGAGYALLHDDHVRIDFLALRMPTRIRSLVEAFVFGLLFSPLLGGLTYVAIARAFEAYVEGKVEAVSPWAPLMWPFYSIIAIGLAVFLLQCCAATVRALINALQDTGHQKA